MYKNDQLSSEKIKLLEGIDFVWDVFEQQWDKNYCQLKKYFKENGHSNCSSNDGSLGIWCISQRVIYDRGKLSQEKINLLEELNFSWDILEQQWNENYLQLKDFYEKGNLKIPRADSLGQWVVNQRQSYRKGKLSGEKVKLLEKINFIWDPTEQKWQENFLQLKDFYEKEGHSNVPATRSSLGAWVNTQRSCFRKKKLTKEKIDILESVNFRWNLHS